MKKTQVSKTRSGLRILSVPMSGTKTATILILVATGSKYETRANNGISHFLEHMFFKGTEKRPTPMEISGELDGLGAEYNAFTSKEYTGYWIKIDSSKLPAAVEVLSDLLLNSKFAQEEIDRERGVVLEEINMRLDNPIIYIDDLFEVLLYGDQPAGWEVIGTRENILKFQRQDFIDYITSQYGSERMVVCLAGKFTPKSLELVKKQFGGVKKAASSKAAKTREAQKVPQVMALYKATDQAHLSVGVRGIPEGHKDEFPLRVLSVLLGGSMSSRMFMELREKRGLAYYVRTEAEFYDDSGYLTTTAGVPLDKIKDALRIIMTEYRKLLREPIRADELKKVKDLICGRVILQLEASDDIANWYARHLLLENKIFSPEDFLKKIRAVRAEDLSRIAKQILVGKNLNLAIIGPYQDGEEFKELLNF